MKQRLSMFGALGTALLISASIAVAEPSVDHRIPRTDVACPEPVPGDEHTVISTGTAGGQPIRIWFSGPPQDWSGGDRTGLLGGLQVGLQRYCLTEGRVRMWPVMIVIGDVGEFDAEVRDEAGNWAGTINGIVEIQSPGPGVQDFHLNGELSIPDDGISASFSAQASQFFGFAP